MIKKLAVSFRVMMVAFLLVFATNLTTVATAYAAELDTDQTVEAVDVPSPKQQNTFVAPNFQFQSFSLGGKVTPLAPTFNDPCGRKSDTYTIPSVNGVIYSVDLGAINLPFAAGTYNTLGASSVRVFATPGLFYSFPSGQQTSWTMNFGGDCAVKLPTPVINDLCGPGNAFWDNQTPSAAYTWSVRDGDHIATANDGYVFEGGLKSKNFGPVVDSNQPCEVNIASAPYVIDPCGLGNAYWNVPEDNDDITWHVDTENGHLYAQTTQGKVFSDSDNATTKDFGSPEDSGVACPVPTYLTICHATSSEDQPYERIQTQDGGFVLSFLTVAPGPDSIYHHFGVDPDDIIPPFGGSGDSESDTNNGQNWTAEGRAIYDNDCEIPVVTPVTPSEPTTGGLGGDASDVLAAITVTPTRSPDSPAVQQLANTGEVNLAPLFIGFGVMSAALLIGLLPRRKLQ